MVMNIFVHILYVHIKIIESSTGILCNHLHLSCCPASGNTCILMLTKAKKRNIKHFFITMFSFTFTYVHFMINVAAAFVTLPKMMLRTKH